MYEQKKRKVSGEAGKGDMVDLSQNSKYEQTLAWYVRRVDGATPSDWY